MFKLESTPSTPEITLDSETKMLELLGRSYGYKSVDLFTHLLTALDEYLESSNDKLTVNMKMDYCDTRSLRGVLRVFRMIAAKKKKTGKDLEVNWHYDGLDDPMFEAGEDISFLTNMKFNFVNYDFHHN